MAIFFQEKNYSYTSLQVLAAKERAQVHISNDLDKDIKTQLTMIGLTENDLAVLRVLNSTSTREREVHCSKFLCESRK